MTGSGTDKSKAGYELKGPVIILVEPQLGENIGMAARAMGNFALSRLRLVNPRDGWPNVSASRAAAGADHIIDHVELFDTVADAVADLDLLFATTARAHDQAKPVLGPEGAAREIVGHVGVACRQCLIDFVGLVAICATQVALAAHIDGNRRWASSQDIDS